jgi:hypothetical protein
MPAAIVSCGAPCSLPASYSFLIGLWSACSANCGGGSQSRSVVCVNTISSATVDIRLCSSSSPTILQACNTNPCVGVILLLMCIMFRWLIHFLGKIFVFTAAPTTASWHVGAWGACTKSCGMGVQIRSVFCLSAQVAVADALCSAFVKPSLVQICNSQACAAATGIFSVLQTFAKVCLPVDTGSKSSELVCRTADSGLNLLCSFCSFFESPDFDQMY